MRALRVTLIVIGIFQLLLGLVFLLAPVQVADLLGLRPAAPAWADWLFAMMAVRFLGYAYGMFVAARAPELHTSWIDTMIVIQLVDWVATLAYLSTGSLHFSQVTTASFMPALFISGLAWWHPRRLRRRSAVRATA
jgi:hypothetical protein